MLFFFNGLYWFYRVLQGINLGYKEGNYQANGRYDYTSVGYKPWYTPKSLWRCHGPRASEGETVNHGGNQLLTGYGGFPINRYPQLIVNSYGGYGYPLAYYWMVRLVVDSPVMDQYQWYGYGSRS